VKCILKIAITSELLLLNAKFQHTEDLNSSTFKPLICFQALSTALNYFSKMKHFQGFFTEARYVEISVKIRINFPGRKFRGVEISRNFPTHNTSRYRQHFSVFVVKIE